MSDVDQMVAHLRAKLDEDERVALAAKTVSGAGDWALNILGHIYSPSLDGKVMAGGMEIKTHEIVSEPPDECAHPVFSDRRVADHCVRHDPDRVLALVAAHREILALHHPVTDGTGEVSCGACWKPRQLYPAAWPCDTLKALASAHADSGGEAGRAA